MYDTVVCVDVFARYSTEDSVAILKQLAALARSRLIFTFTPKKVLDPALLVIARIVAKRRQAPPLHTHRTDVITGALGAIGWMILREQEISAGRRSYFCRLVQASPDPDSAGRGS